MQRAGDEIVALPNSFSFGLVPLHGGKTTKFTLKNFGRAPIAITGFRMDGAQGSEFYPFGELVTLDVAEEATVRLVFRPGEEGPRSGELVVLTDSGDYPETRIKVDGNGIDSAVKLDGNSLDFGKIELLSSRTLTVALTNPSILDANTRFEVIGADKDEFVVEGPDTVAAHGAGEVTVTFKPTRVGKPEAALAVEPCNDCPSVPVWLSGEGIDSALVFDPASVDFGALPVDGYAERTVKVTNISDLPVEVTAVAASADSDMSMHASGAWVPGVVEPGQTRELKASFQPSFLGPAKGQLQVSSTSPYKPERYVPMTGNGGGSEIAVSPQLLDYNNRIVGSKTRQSVRVQNMGSSNAGDLVITKLYLYGDPAFTFTGPTTPIPLKGGEFFDVDVFFEPMQAGDLNSGLYIEYSINGVVQKPDLKVPLWGRGQETLPCDVKVTPLAMDFGSVPVGRYAVLGFKVENVGQDRCAIKNIQITDSADGAFVLSGNVPPGINLDPGEWFIRHMHFEAKVFGPKTGMLQFEKWGPNPVVKIPLKGNGQTGCLDSQPRYIDWGLVNKTCPPSGQTVHFTNICNQNLYVGNIVIGDSRTGDDFQIWVKPATPMTLVPGDGFDVEVGYLAQTPGETLAPLFVDVSGLNAPLIVPLHGEVTTDKIHKDEFVQQDGKKVDVLLVVDNTESMVEEQPRLKAAIPSFISAAKAKGVDLHVGVTTTGLDPSSAGSCPGGVKGGENGRLFPVDQTRARILTMATPDLEATLAANTEVGYCHRWEQAFEAMRSALTSPLIDHADDPRTREANDGNKGFYRDDAALSVLFVTDEDDHSGSDVDSYVTFLKNLKGIGSGARVSVNAIAPTAQGCATAGGAGLRYLELTGKMGGQVSSVCSSDFAPALTDVANKSFGPQQVFSLSAKPQAGTLKVYVNGGERTSGWTYDATLNQVVFDAGSIPPAGAKVSLQYEQSCGK